MTDEQIWSDEPPTEPGWYWIDCAAITTRFLPLPTRRLGWLEPTGWSIPSVGFGLDGDYLREIGIKFGPRVPDLETCAWIQREKAGAVMDDKRCGTCNYFGMIGGTLKMCTWGDSRSLPVCIMKDLVHPDDGKDCPCWKPQTEAYRTVVDNFRHNMSKERRSDGRGNDAG